MLKRTFFHTNWWNLVVENEKMSISVGFDSLVKIENNPSQNVMLAGGAFKTGWNANTYISVNYERNLLKFGYQMPNTVMCHVF